MIKPTVGRIVHYFPHDHAAGDQPLAAIVTYVWSDQLVNLSVFDANGVQSGETSVTLHQEGAEKPTGRRCEWMPYQVAKAKEGDHNSESANRARRNGGDQVRWCGICKRAPREDDPMRHGTLAGAGQVQIACRDCFGDPTPVYPVRAQMPTVTDFRTGGSRLIRLCGVTRNALREDQDETIHIRLAPEDVVGETDGLGQPLAPGLYSVSRETLERFRPRMLERLRRTQAIDDRGELVFDDGEPVMVVSSPAQENQKWILQ